MQKAIIITAPSGAGKTTLVKKLLQERSDLAFSVSACTRHKRENEVEGKDYYFITPQQFQQKIKEGAFAEWEEVYENMYYGTLMSEIERIWADNKTVIFDIDVKGALSLKKKLGSKALAVFIAPPSVKVLKSRLENRGTENQQTLQKRVDKALYEMKYKEAMDTFVINDNLEEAFQQLSEKVDEFIHLDE